MINYIVGIYVGDRNNKSVSALTKDPTYMVKLHFDALSSLSVPMIKKATFVVSPSSSNERDSQVLEFIKTNSAQLSGIEVDCFIGENNQNHSYGSWNFGMNKYIDDDLHFFLIEDDYIPCSNEFYAPFIEKINDKTAYVSQLYFSNRGQKNHAAISNGLMNIEAARNHHKKFGNSININLPAGKPHDVGVYSQLNFLKLFEGLGYSIADVAGNYCHPFLERNNRISIYGNPRASVLLNPVFYEDSMRKSYTIKK